MALSHFKTGPASQYDREMKQCGRVGHPLAEVQQNNENMDRQRHFLVSTNCYYGYQPLNIERSRPHEEEMEIGDCEMTPLQTPASRKRTFDDVSGRQYKRFRTEEPTVAQPVCYSRPTHNNPDISRCLMAHMI